MCYDVAAYGWAAQCWTEHGVESSLLDLAAAYRQLCVAPTSRAFSYICVYNPRKRVNEVFSQVWSKAAVNAFIRCSRCIQWLACKCLLLPTTCYYDDFVVIATPQLQSSSESAMSLLFEMLGWAYDKEGPKADTFSEVVASLGVSISLVETIAGEIKVMNTEKRKKDLVELITSVVNLGTLQYKEGQVLNGKLTFAHGQIFGLAGKYVLQAVHELDRFCSLVRNRPLVFCKTRFLNLKTCVLCFLGFLVLQG